mmetsp:Transcript_8476/g.19195  ORF Transcript_8476/g.19195 Transcript_8476/m.19195 type:complete len:250 (-) Transcript_8476:580-1329(-)
MSWLAAACLVVTMMAREAAGFQRLPVLHTRRSCNSIILPSSPPRSSRASSCTVMSLQNEAATSRRSLLASSAMVAVCSLLVPAANAEGKVQLEGDKMVKATSPGVALDMIITMKVAKNYRELLSKIEGSDFKSAVSFLSNPWTNGSARFLKKNKVLESLATSLKGVSAGEELDSDPSFNNESSPDSLAVASKVANLYETFDKLEAACKEQNREEAIKQYNTGKLKFDEILKQLDLPTVDYADSKKIVTP